MHDALIIAAAGTSTRFGGKNKVLELLDDKPAVIHCLENLASEFKAESIRLVVNQEQERNFLDVLRQYGWSHIRLVYGGATRSDSIRNALESLPEHTGLVAIHDAARPLATRKLLEQCLEQARIHGAAIAAHPITDTVKQADNEHFAINTLDRTTLWAAETPQVARYDWLVNAFKSVNLENITDEAQRLELDGHPPKIVPNTSPNYKITFPQDIEIVKYILENKNRLEQ